ncbi:hypothetical protein [Nocardia sp. IFM 10818]
MPEMRSALDELVTESPGLAGLLSAIDAEQTVLQDVAGEISEIAAEAGRR